MSIYRLASLLLSFFISFSINAQDKSIRVALASSLVPAMEEIKQAFEMEYDMQIDLIPGASGTLTNQILHGAPYDIFISANEKYSQILLEKGILKDAPIQLVNGSLVIWSDRQLTDRLINDNEKFAKYLNSSEVETIALAQPGLAPYGDASKSFLIKLGVFNQLQPKLIYGNNLTITNQYIYAKSTNLVFTSLSSQKKMMSMTPNYWYSIKSPFNLTHTISQVKNSADGSGKFQNFLFQKEAFYIFEKFGYSLIVQ